MIEQHGNSLSNSGRSWHKVVAVLCCLVLVALGVSWKVLEEIKSETKEHVEYSLQVVLDTTHKSILLWIHDRLDDAELIASRPDVVALTKELLKAKANNEILYDNRFLEELRALLRSYLELHKD
ncbi:MAG: hypothetical protein OEV64_03200, partial [Desulfobulbaceae bacterium]|nr:hypothetical protein [Desulfobulbaceae bacterium]